MNQLPIEHRINSNSKMIQSYEEEMKSFNDEIDKLLDE